MKGYHIAITSLVRSLPLTEARIRRLVRCILRSEKVKSADLSIAAVGEKRMADIAEQYARRRYRTDVFAFDLSDAKNALVGQIIVNVPLAREQARKLKADPAAELALYIAHGLLHLVGYDDHRKDDAEVMHRRALRYLIRAGFSKPPPLPDVR